ncbi:MULTISPECIES: aromatic amino acid ammonia-lyase [Chelativorans]|jgi:histidine ammonia-lyase|uniref:Phenylalanine/histidine ammonia-lyase n=1 Tax=Chelativorans sp. (strain BNC1) TaxID=266779 RepID=Q11F16_CHESB|nr:MULTISPECIES: aromatic amino acid ammonia-lyase [Chelativorans]
MSSSDKDLVLGTGALKPEDVAAAAATSCKVLPSPQGMERADLSRSALAWAARADIPIYGVNRGVGMARQVRIDDYREFAALDEEERSRQFNRNLLLSHCRAIGQPIDRVEVRAAMIVRLNTLLAGGSGISAEAIQLLLAMVNRSLSPIVPGTGSVGVGDLSSLSYIGAAMMGVGHIQIEDGTVLPADEALRRASLPILRPVGRDAMALMSSNALSAGQGCLLLEAARTVLAAGNITYAMSLEALNGNVAPLLEIAGITRPFMHYTDILAQLRDILDGSYLWRPSPERYLQDPLSFRTAPLMHAVCAESIDRLGKNLSVQINSIEDNPSIVTCRADDVSEHLRPYFGGGDDHLFGGAIPTAYFDPLPWVLDIQSMAVAFAHLSNASMQRAGRLINTHFTKIDMLARQPTASAFGFAKICNVLQAQIAASLQPLSTLVQPSAGDIEDVGNHAPTIVRRAAQAMDDVLRMLSVELVVADSLITARRDDQPGLSLGRGSAELHQSIRDLLSKSPDPRPGTAIDRIYDALKAGKLDNAQH